MVETIRPNVESDDLGNDKQFEQLADWLMRYETSRSETSRRLPLLEVTTQEIPETRTELSFERRHEIKDDAHDSAIVSRAARLEPMIPIASLLQADPKNAKVTPRQIGSTPQVSVSRHKKLPHLTYAQAIRNGFFSGMAVLILFAMVAMLR